jgi:hypothetical protein
MDAEAVKTGVRIKEGKQMEEKLNEELYKMARERVEAEMGFYVHLFFYLLVNLFLFVINLWVNILASRRIWWFFWPLLGWGIGLLAHFLFVFGTEWERVRRWRERKIMEIMERERRERR